MKTNLRLESRIAGIAMLSFILTTIEPVYAADVSRRTFLGTTAASVMLLPTSCPLVFAATPSAVYRSTTLFQTVMVSRWAYKTVVATTSTDFLPAGETYQVATNEPHPLRRLLSWAHSGDHDPTTAYNRFESGDLPEWMQTILRSWTKNIVEAQDRLAERLQIPIERIKVEVDDILDPRNNNAYWISDRGADPNPVSLGLDFQKMFIEEIRAHQPDLSAALQERLERELNDEGGFHGEREFRFTANGPFGEYLRKTGRRISLSTKDYSDLKAQLNHARFAIFQTQTGSVPNYFSESDQTTMRAIGDQLQSKMSPREAPLKRPVKRANLPEKMQDSAAVRSPNFSTVAIRAVISWLSPIRSVLTREKPSTAVKSVAAVPAPVVPALELSPPVTFNNGEIAKKLTPKRAASE